MQKKKTYSAALQAASLQDHINVTYGVTGKSVVSTVKERGKKNNLKPAKRTEFVINPRSSHRPVSLADQFGLIKVSRKKASTCESVWATIKQKCMNRLDHIRPCSICHEYFGRNSVVLLDCTHLFHKNCLDSFEKFSQHTRCPICRADDYEKRVVFFAEDAYLDNMATLIQAAWRGRKARKSADLMRLKSCKPSDPLTAQVRNRKMLSLITDRAVQLIDQHHTMQENDIDTLFNEIDSALAQNKQIMAQWDEKLGVQDVGTKPVATNWYACWGAHLNRETPACPICLFEWSRASARVLLSCSHVFHRHCLEQLEKHCDYTTEDRLCPICRWPNYEKRNVPGADRIDTSHL